MASIDPKVGQYVRPGWNWGYRPWCRVVEVGVGECFGACQGVRYFVAEYPPSIAGGATERYLQWEIDHNFRFTEVADEPGERF